MPRGQQSTGSTPQAPPSLVLPATASTIDDLIGSTIPRLISPIDPPTIRWNKFDQHRHIYILSPEVVATAKIGSSVYADRGPSHLDPTFALSWLDNRIANDESKISADQIRDNKIDERAMEAHVQRQRATDTLRDLTVICRGKAVECGDGDPKKDGKERPAERGLLSRCIMESAVAKKKQKLELMDFTTWHEDEKAYARALSYVKLAKALKKKYQTPELKKKYGKQVRVVLLLDANDRDEQVWQYLQHLDSHVTVHMAPSTDPVAWVNHDNHRGETWFMPRKGLPGQVATWDERLATVNPFPLESKFILAIDTNFLLNRNDDGSRLTGTTVNQLLSYSEDTGSQYLTVGITQTVVAELDQVAKGAKLTVPSKWCPAEITLPKTALPPLDVNWENWWIRKQMVGDPRLRLDLFGGGITDPIILATGDAGMTTAAWHYGRPVIQVTSGVKAELNKFLRPKTKEGMSKLFTNATFAYARHSAAKEKTATRGLGGPPSSAGGPTTSSLGGPSSDRGITTRGLDLPHNASTLDNHSSASCLPPKLWLWPSTLCLSSHGPNQPSSSSSSSSWLPWNWSWCGIPACIRSCCGCLCCGCTCCRCCCCAAEDNSHDQQIRPAQGYGPQPPMVVPAYAQNSLAPAYGEHAHQAYGQHPAHEPVQSQYPSLEQAYRHQSNPGYAQYPAAAHYPGYTAGREHPVQQHATYTPHHGYRPQPGYGQHPAAYGQPSGYRHGLHQGYRS